VPTDLSGLMRQGLTFLRRNGPTTTPPWGRIVRQPEVSPSRSEFSLGDELSVTRGFELSVTRGFLRDFRDNGPACSRLPSAQRNNRATQGLAFPVSIGRARMVASTRPCLRHCKRDFRDTTARFARIRAGLADTKANHRQNKALHRDDEVDHRDVKAPSPHDEGRLRENKRP
jgi:hypothetical protein